MDISDKEIPRLNGGRKEVSETEHITQGFEALAELRFPSPGSSRIGVGEGGLFFY